MLTPYDISMMENSVRDIISMWDTRLTVLKPLPIDQQPNWNEHMHEYSGDIHYMKYVNVPMERKDQVNMNIYDTDIRAGAGDDKDGRLTFTTSDLNTFIDDTCRIIYEGDQWRISIERPRIGEIVMIVTKIVGSDERWHHEPDSTIDVSGGDANV